MCYILVSHYDQCSTPFKNGASVGLIRGNVGVNGVSSTKSGTESVMVLPA